MPETPYKSTPVDRRRAVTLGIVYVLLAIALAVMLFKIWPAEWSQLNSDHKNVKELELCQHLNKIHQVRT